MTMTNQPLPNLSRGLRRFWWPISAAIPALAVALQMPIFDRTAIPMDEGQMAVAATRILDGDVLYRDIYTGIGPGIYHFTAALFAVFGRDLLVTRWAEVGVNAAIALCLWLLAARVVRLHWAALPPLAFLMLVAISFPVLTMLNYSSLALLGALISLLLLQRYLDSASMLEGVLLGLVLGATALTKQNFGLFTIVAIGIALIWNRGSSPLSEFSLWRGLAPIVVGGASTAFVVIAYFGIHGALGDLIAATLLDIGGPQLEAFDNPIPSIFGAMPSEEPRFIFLLTSTMWSNLVTDQ